MEGGEILPQPLPEFLAQLREQAHAMPLSQLTGVLDEAWGPDWTARFRRFRFAPMAAASIGQVHAAQTSDGRWLAIKIQYPGIARSIDSDLGNVAAMLRLFRVLPEGIDLDPLLAEARRQLHQETNYLFEAEQLEAYRLAAGGQSGLRVPALARDLTTSRVLAMELVEGEPIESLDGAPQRTRDRIGTRLVDLALREVFDWGLVQTDPNFANFRFRAEDDALVLLDFGAARRYDPSRIHAFRRLLRAGVGDDRRVLESAVTELGYIAPEDPAAYREAVVDIVRMATEPARRPGAFDFATADLGERLTERIFALRAGQGFGRLPPSDILYLHRKLGGLYLLCRRLSARVPVSGLIDPHLG
jgi:predicted unusual protein kinase regulating ubiquinone biosynthesis (AarF/ABC1/UbiB family)